MKNVFKKIINRMYITFILIGLIAPIRHVFAEFTKPFRIDEYELLAPLPTLDSPFKTGDLNNLFNYLNIIIPIFIGLCAVLAVIMIIMGGIQYMTSELISSKEEGKKRITNAIFGLLLALGAWLILYTINPNILNPDLSVIEQQTVNVTISPEDTSSGSDASLCISSSNPPNPDSATGSTVTPNASITGSYIPAMNSLGLSNGTKLLITAQTHIEGFYPGRLSYRTNNPGNIGNTDDGKTKTYPTLVAGIQAQANLISNVAGGSSPSYKIGGKYSCALGNETYDGSLYQYLRIYSTGARTSNTYVNAIIGYYKQNGVNINARTKMSQLMNT